MKNVVARLRLVVLALILPGVSCLVWNHLRGNDIIKLTGIVLIVVALMLSLLPLIGFFLTSLFPSRSKDGKKK
jgi:hypothetical protein